MIRPYTTSANETVTLGTETSSLATTTVEASTEAATHTQFDWTEPDKQLILGSFFWGYILTELPGGRLAELVGGHRVFGHSMLWASVLTLITPFAANLGLAAMVTQRALLGFCLGGLLATKFDCDLKLKFVLLMFSFMACNPSNDCCVDPSNGPLEIHLQYDGFGSWCSRHHAYLWLPDPLVRLA